MKKFDRESTSQEPESKLNSQIVKWLNRPPHTESIFSYLMIFSFLQLETEDFVFSVANNSLWTG